MSPKKSERPSSGKGEGLFFLEHPFFLGSLVIGAVVFALYSVSLGHNFLFDEENIILRNPLIRSLSLVPELFRHGYFYFEGRAADWTQYYRPLTSLTFALDHALWKFDPFGYNLTNVFLHIAVSVLLFFLLNRSLGRKLPAFLAALLWSAHTIHTEAVTYTASRGDLLGALLMLAVLLLYWEKRTVTALAVYGLALFAKESSLLLPLYLVALEASLLRGSWRRSTGRLAPFFAAAALFFVFRKFFSPVPLGPPSNDAAEALLRVLSMGEGFTAYLEAVLFPEAFKFCKSLSFTSSLLSWKVIQTLAIAVLLAAGWFIALRRRGAAFFGMSIFLIGLIPYSQIVHFYPEWAEHYLYVPSMGLAILLGGLIAALPKKLPAQVLAALMAGYFVFFGFLCYRTWQRNALYQDTVKYYKRLAQSDSPYAYYGYQNLARLLIEHGRWDEAVVPLKTAFAIEPHSDVTQNLLGLYYLEKKEVPRAIGHFKEAYAHSGDLKYLANAGAALIRIEAYPDAIEMFKAIGKAAPAQLSVYTNLIGAYELSGDPQSAKDWGEKGIRVFDGKNKETAVLLMAMTRLAYRQDWTDAFRVHIRAILEKCPDTFWYGDLARLMDGKMDPGNFLEMVPKKYPGFEAAGKAGVLIFYVSSGQRDLAARFYASNRDVLEEQAAAHPLIAREIEKARTFFSS